MWNPLLKGEQAQRALKAASEIACDLRRTQWNGDDPGLANGLPGAALFLGYLARVRPEAEGHRALAEELLERASLVVAQTAIPPWLHAGFTGTAWVTAHLEVGTDPLDEDDALSDIDEAVRLFASRSPWRGNYDLISGLVGLGVYALERHPRASAHTCLTAIVDRLEDLASHDEAGTYWLSPQHLLPEWQRKLSPEGLVDLGMAHGMAGVTVFLSAVCSLGVAVPKARPMLEGAVHWLRSHKSPVTVPAFPDCLGPNYTSPNARSAWCYGDPGISAALMIASQAAKREPWAREALDIAVGASEAPPESVRAEDAGLCHGAAGRAHIFNRLHQASGDPRLGEAAREWYERALATRTPGEGIGGFRSWSVDGRETWSTDPGFLTGASGTGLALLAAATDMEPAWDRALLLSIPH